MVFPTELSAEVDQINSYLSNLRTLSPYDDEINDLIDDIIQKGGKRLRPLICLLSFEMISHKKRNNVNLAAACALEVIHNASLLIDDIFDKDVFRRKEKSFYLKYSTFAALSISYSMSSLALSLATKTNILEIIEELLRALHTLSTSLFLEQKFRKGGKLMSKEEALILIDRKTSCLFEAASIIGVIMGSSSTNDREKMRMFGKYFGRAFQLRDDILSLTYTTNELGKSGVWTDISNKIQTYLVLEALEIAKADTKEVLEGYYLKGKNHSVAEVKKAIKNSGAVKSIKYVIENYVNKAIEILGSYPPSIPREKLMEITKSLSI
ncbi:MAG: polyprenyl synthetase family protein [Candidatus Heimdallarchaeaceae archaeon]